MRPWVTRRCKIGNLAFNQALGRLNEFAERVNDNDPAGAEFDIALFEGSITDDTAGDLDTMADVTGSALTESTATNYARIVLTDLDVGASTVDDGANTRSFDIADQVWTSLGPGTAITRLVIAYGEGGVDSTLIPCAIYDFPVTPNGGNVTAQINASGLWTATRV